MAEESIKIQLADDTLKERAAIKKQLMQSGVEAVVVAETGVGAEAITAAHDFSPDIVLLSLEEPVARRLRILESLAMMGEAAIIVISSIGDRDSLRKAMRAGAKEYLVKPLDARELAKTIESVFAAERQRKSLLGNGGVVTRGHGDVITVFSPKGGTGRTTLVANLAVALSMETDRRIVLLDLNLEHGDVPMMLDIAPEKSVVDVMRIVDRLDTEMIQGFLCRHNSGVEVLSGPTELCAVEARDGEHIGKVIELLSRSFDYVVVDTPPRLCKLVLAAFEHSSMIFLVSTPEVPCLKNSKDVLEMLKSQHAHNGKVKLVLNEAYASDGVANNEVGKAMDYPIFWKVPHDSTVLESIKLGKPFVQDRAQAKVSRNIADLARTLGGIQKPQKKLLGLFAR